MSLPLHLNETTGSIGEIKESKLSEKSETTGSVGYMRLCDSPAPDITRTLSRDTVSFKGYDYEEGGISTGTKIFGVAGAAALAMIGLGYAQKSGSISKIPNENVRNVLNKIAEPCHKVCSKILNFSREYFDKIKGFFNKK